MITETSENESYHLKLIIEQMSVISHLMMSSPHNAGNAAKMESYRNSEKVTFDKSSLQAGTIGNSFNFKPLYLEGITTKLLKFCLNVSIFTLLIAVLLSKSL